MERDRPLLGIVLMLGFCILAPLGDAVAKSLGGIVSIGALVFVRFAVQLVLLLPLMSDISVFWRLERPLAKLIALRTILHIAGIAMMFTAVTYLPLADAIAIAFVMPFIMLLLGKLVLEEEVGSRRLIACGVGFVGTLLVVQPAFSDVGWPALLPLGVAVVFALFMLVTRQVSRQIDPVTLQAVSGAMACVALFPFVFLIPAMPLLAWGGVSWEHAAMLLLLGGLGTAAHLLMTWALRFAPSATLAPMQYLEIPFATLIGLIVFGDFPNSLASLGICVTMAAGLYVIYRERAMSRARPA